MVRRITTTGEDITQMVWYAAQGRELGDKRFVLEWLLRDCLCEMTIAILTRNPHNDWKGVDEVLEMLLS